MVMKLRAGALSITGRFRENNEDACHVDPEARFFVVADGMGGQSAGERASAMAVEIVPRILGRGLTAPAKSAAEIVKLIDHAVSQANSEILALGEIDSRLHNMGTTIAFVVLQGDDAFIGGVGDSRVYLLRDGNIQQLTTDHSLTQALVDAGTLTPEEALTHRYRNVLYRYLGSKDGGTGTAPRTVKLQPGDRLILCSDGVTGGVSDAELATLLASGDDPEALADAIIKAAESGGSKDNITAIVIFTEA